MKKELTKREREVFEFLHVFKSISDWMPTRDEITLEMGWKSHQQATRIIGILEDKGYIEAEHGSPRALRFSSKGRLALGLSEKN